MKKISVIVLADNKEDMIEGCLKAVNWAEEIILIDTGSTDQTVNIAKKYHCRIIQASPEINFSQWRNLGAKEAAGEWLLYVDVDERITSSLCDEIKNKILKIKTTNKKLKKEIDLINGYFIPRKNYFWGKEFKTSYPDYQLRLINKKSLVSWQGKIHEVPKIKGKIDNLNHPLIHLSHRSLETALKNTLNWSKIEAENRLLANHPPMTGWRFVRIIFTSFWDQFINKKVYKEGVEGVIEGIYQTFSLFFTYVRLWELQRGKSLTKTYQYLDSFKDKQ